MDCPRHAVPLVARPTGAACPHCGGAFLAAGSGPAPLAEAVARAAPRLAALPEGPLRCPADGTPMRVWRHAGVELDYCPACGGLWCDPGERLALAGAPPGKAAPASRANPANDSNAVELFADGAETVLDLGADDLLGFVGKAVGALLDGW